jgi:hypothetical protein
MKKGEKTTKIKNIFSYILVAILGVIAIFAIFGGNLKSSPRQSEELNGKKYMLLFHSERCPHCIAARKFINERLKSEFPNIVFKEYETSLPETRAILKDYAEKLKFSPQYVPIAVFSNDKVVTGFGTESDTGEDYRNLLKSL